MGQEKLLSLIVQLPLRQCDSEIQTVDSSLLLSVSKEAKKSLGHLDGSFWDSLTSRSASPQSVTSFCHTLMAVGDGTRKSLAAQLYLVLLSVPGSGVFS